MKDKLFNWLNEALSHGVSDEIRAFCFNLYDDGDSKWSMELIGTSSFDSEDSDWACDEVTVFDTRENPYTWEENSKWDAIQNAVADILKLYLDEGKNSNLLKQKEAVAVGFTDGDLDVIYCK